MRSRGTAGRRHPGGGRLPWAPLPRPLAECRLALVVSSVCLSPSRSAGPGVEVGEPRVRVIPGDVSAGELLAVAGRSSPGGKADPSAANLDRNLAQALDRLREAAAAGRIGGLSRRHVALGGVMAATAHAISRRAPEITRLCAEDGVEAVLLVPT